jgi:hypothetical protein
MKQSLFVLVVMLLAAPVYAAVGDLTLKACNPNEVGGWSVRTSGPQDILPAPANCGTVNPKAKVITLRSRDGRTFLTALDSAKPDDKILNVLRLDMTGTGKFTPEMSVECEWPNADGSGVAQSGPLAVQLSQGGKTVPAEARGRITATAGNELTAVNLTFGTCLEGQCAFGDKTRTLRFIDADNNGKWDDPAKVRVQDGVPRGRVAGDRMQNAAADGKFEWLDSYGQPLFIEGKWYDVAISADTAKVTATLLKDPIGKFQVDAAEWTATLLTADRIFALKGGKDPVDVPAGKYVLWMASIKLPHVTAGITGANDAAGKPALLEVVAGKTTEKAFGPPFLGHLNVVQQDRQVMLTLVVFDAAGRSVGIRTDGTLKDTGKIQVYGPDGKLATEADQRFL